MAGLIVIFPIGLLINAISPKIYMPLFYLIRSGILFLFYNSKDPKGAYFIIVAPLMHIGMNSTQVAVMSYQQAQYPK